MTDRVALNFGPGRGWDPVRRRLSRPAVL